jgi:hypothetical protein
MRGGGSDTDGRAIAIVLKSHRAAEVEGAEDEGQRGWIEVLKNTGGGDEGTLKGGKVCGGRKESGTSTTNMHVTRMQRQTSRTDPS